MSPLCCYGVFYKMQNSKSKIELKYRAYEYSIKLIGFPDTLPKDESNQVVTLGETKESANILGSSILTLKGKR